jgi:Zn-finger nucleic acid-binding protein
MATCPNCEAAFDPIEDVDVTTGDVPETHGSQAVYLCPDCETVLGYSQVGPF